MHKNLKQFTKTTRRFTIALALVITGTAWGAGQRHDRSPEREAVRREIHLSQHLRLLS